MKTTYFDAEARRCRENAEKSMHFSRCFSSANLRVSAPLRQKPTQTIAAIVSRQPQGCDDQINYLDADERHKQAAQTIDQQIALQ